MTPPLDAARVICSLDDLAGRPCRAFTLGGGAWPLAGFVLRRGDRLYAYRNRCPHAGHRLDLRPHDFLTADGSLIVCRSHGALFEIETGYCVDGPCRGRALEPLPVEVVAGHLLLGAGVDLAGC